LRRKLISVVGIGFRQSNAIEAFLRQVCHQLHRPTKQLIQIGNLEAVCLTIDAGVALGILPESAAGQHSHNTAISLVPLSDPIAFNRL
jgi:hypothetical protein